jgi:hypothetical protein
MNTQERLNLKKLMGSMKDEYEDNTEGIRRVKHSSLIHKDIVTMENLKKSRNTKTPEEFSLLCQQECSFLFVNYTDIYNRLLRDELDLKIMTQALTVLKKIEDGKIDQQEGSVEVGKLFHKLFVDSALRRSENLDKEYGDSVPERNSGKAMSWKEYKKNNSK